MDVEAILYSPGAVDGAFTILTTYRIKTTTKKGRGKLNPE